MTIEAEIDNNVTTLRDTRDVSSLLSGIVQLTTPDLRQLRAKLEEYTPQDVAKIKTALARLQEAFAPESPYHK